MKKINLKYNNLNFMVIKNQILVETQEFKEFQSNQKYNFNNRKLYQIEIYHNQNIQRDNHNYIEFYN